MEPVSFQNFNGKPVFTWVKIGQRSRRVQFFHSILEMAIDESNDVIMKMIMKPNETNEQRWLNDCQGKCRLWKIFYPYWLNSLLCIRLFRPEKQYWKPLIVKSDIKLCNLNLTINLTGLTYHSHKFQKCPPPTTLYNLDIVSIM